MTRYCAACKKANNEKKFRLPNPKKLELQDLLRKWILFIDNPSYETKTSEYLYNNVYVCALHFKPEDFVGPGIRLKYLACPTITTTETQTQATEDVLSMDVEEIQENITTNIHASEPSTSAMEIEDIPAAVTLTGSRQHKKKQHKISEKFQIRKLRKKIKMAKKDKSSLKMKLKRLEKLERSCNFQTALRNMTEEAATFINCQLREAKKTSKGRRFTLKEKVLCLSLYKQGPKAYRQYSRIFALPSQATLTKVLQGLPLKVGINEEIINYLSVVSSSLKEEDKYVALLFDEIFLMPGLKYDPYKQKIYGFEDTGMRTTNKFSDHATVFMVRGLYNNWKFPLAFYFSEGGMKSADLAATIKIIVGALKSCKLNVIALICDQGSNNVAAINYLKNLTKQECTRINKVYDGAIVIEGITMYNIYDPPHLLKGVRNNLLKGDLVFKWDNMEHKASWKHIEQAYEEDYHKSIRAMPKLTDYHVKKGKMKLMKVKYCTQVFSQRVASQISLLAEYATEDVIDKEAKGTALLLNFFDKLFDSLNGSQYVDAGKPLRSALRHGSDHFKFWFKSIEVIKTMYFIRNEQKVIPPSLKNFIITIENTMKIWAMLNGSGFIYFLTRRLNQDPLENFFSAIRSHGFRSNRPTTVQFVAAFKTLLINNISSKQSANANCECDSAVSITEYLNLLLNIDAPKSPRHATTTNDDQNVISIESQEINMLFNFKLAYFAGYILKKLQEIFRDCSDCNQNLIASTPNAFHSLIERREYNQMRHLLYPSTTFINIVNDMHIMLSTELQNDCINLDRLGVKLQNLDLNLSCDLHCATLKEALIKKVSTIFIFSWCRTINLILNGKMQIKSSEKDHIKRNAFHKFNKLRKRFRN